MACTTEGVFGINEGCDVVIYNMKDIFGVHLISGTELLTLLDFLSDKSNEEVFYVNKVTFGKHLGMGLAARNTSHVIRGLELSVSPP